jgi:GT2 family glycosyltransferase
MSASSSRVSVIVQAFDFGKPLEQCVFDIRRHSPPGTEILVAAPGGNRAAVLNETVSACRGEVLFFIPSFVDIGADMIPDYLTRMDEDPGSGMVYGDYMIAVAPDRKVRQTLLANEGNLSEWSSVGYVTAVRKSAFASAGGYDSSYGSAAEYNLRLRLTRSFRLARVAEPLYGIDKASVPFEDERVKESLRLYFTPESSPKKGFGYLFNAPGAALEVERAFTAELRARGAYLAGDTRPVECPHSGPGPTVSVLIPVYNRAGFLRRAIESILAGTYREVEIIVVDGGSTDGTAEEVASLQRRFSNVRLLRNPSNQIATALNLGLRAARGKYISQLDSDDEYTPTTLEMMVAYLESHPECALAISYYDFIDSDGQTLPDIGTIKHLEYDRNAILRTDGAGAVRTWHRCVLEKLGGFDELHFYNYAEDYDMILRLSEHFAVGRVHEVLYRCRQHSSNNEKTLSIEFRAKKKALARTLALKRRTERNRGIQPI